VNNVGEHTRGAVRRTAPARKATAGRPAERVGIPCSGRIVRLLIGQGHGFIRLANGREVFFHRSDVREGVSFNRFTVGDTVDFELLDDRISGPRAVQVEPAQPRR
jgi:cold shock CspA family protein